MTTDKSLAQVLREQTNQVSNGLNATLLRHLRAMPIPAILSAPTEKEIKKRVPPKALQRYLDLEGAIGLLANEVSDLGTRISRYQYIERYREHFKAPNADMRMAFVSHTHILRGSEIYVIMERCGGFLDFLFHVAADLALAPKKMKSTLEKRFKKQFERHLRERHRIVHAHERPSLISRMVDLNREDLEQPETVEAFQATIQTVVKLLHPIVGEADIPDTPEKYLEQINVERLKAVDNECFEMWSILLDAINQLIDPTKLLKKAG